MVRPYLPRFLREGDRAELKIVVNNAGEQFFDGALNLKIFDPATGEDLRPLFGLSAEETSGVAFSVDAGKGADLSFSELLHADLGRIGIVDALDALEAKVVIGEDDDLAVVALLEEVRDAHVLAETRDEVEVGLGVLDDEVAYGLVAIQSKLEVGLERKTDGFELLADDVGDAQVEEDVGGSCLAECPDARLHDQPVVGVVQSTHIGMRDAEHPLRAGHEPVHATQGAVEIVEIERSGPADEVFDCELGVEVREGIDLEPKQLRYALAAHRPLNVQDRVDSVDFESQVDVSQGDARWPPIPSRVPQGGILPPRPAAVTDFPPVK